MPHPNLKATAEADQDREAVADMVAMLREVQPAFLVSVCEVIDSEEEIEATGGTHVVLPILTFRTMARLAKLGAIDADRILRGREEAL